MTTSFSPQALRDIEAIGAYIERDSPGNARLFVEEMHRQIERIAAMPLAYRVREELGSDFRGCPFGRYVIFFKSRGTDIRIMRVLHSAMDIGNQLKA